MSAARIAAWRIRSADGMGVRYQTAVEGLAPENLRRYHDANHPADAPHSVEPLYELGEPTEWVTYPRDSVLPSGLFGIEANARRHATERGEACFARHHIDIEVKP